MAGTRRYWYRKRLVLTGDDMRRKIIYIVPLLLAFTACGGGNDKTPEPKGDAAGRKLYSSKCSSCHGSDGKQGVGGAKDLSVSTLTMDQRIQIITNGKGMMPGYASVMSGEEIQAVAEYTATLKK